MYIAIDDISITHLVFDEDFTNAIERKQVAQQDVERVKVRAGGVAPPPLLPRRVNRPVVRRAKGGAGEIGCHYSLRGRVRSREDSHECTHCRPGAAGAAALGGCQRNCHDLGQITQCCIRTQSWQHDFERAQELTTSVTGGVATSNFVSVYWLIKA